MDISLAELLDLVDEGLAALPQAHAAVSRDRLRQMAMTATRSISTSSAETAELAAAMQPFGGLILDRPLEAIAKRAVVSVPLPLCNAVAKVRDGQDCIFLFDGLFDVAVANLAMSYAIQGLPPLFDTVFPRPDYPEISARQWVSVLLGSLVNRFVTHAEPLPDFRVLHEPPGVEIELQHGLIGAAWWTLLHELGHFELGHLTNAARGARPSIRGELVLDQDLSDFQLEEFAADDYAFEALTSDGKAVAYGWATYALAPSMMLETLTATKGTASHPLTVNRLDRARTHSTGLDPVMDTISNHEHLRERARAHLNIGREHANLRSMGEQPMFDGWPAEAIHTALRGLRGLFDAAGMDLEGFQGSTFSWRSLPAFARTSARSGPPD